MIDSLSKRNNHCITPFVIGLVQNPVESFLAVTDISSEYFIAVIEILLTSEQLPVHLTSLEIPRLNIHQRPLFSKYDPVISGVW